MRLSQATPPIARGEEYRNRLQKFLTQGTLYIQSTNHVIIRRLVLEGNQNSFAYGICCFRCSTISWTPDDVNGRYCPSCRIYHGGIQ